jgi:DDB1- and CUL4-associated factor 7
LIVTASIDTTCTVWDLNTLHAKTHLIAHDKEVFDVAFVAGSENIFASCGADGSVRMFDLRFVVSFCIELMRSLDHSTIIYESPQVSIGPMSSHVSTAATTSPTPLLRISPCSKDANLLATFHLDSSIVLVLDVRQPGKELYNLTAHTGNINASSSVLCPLSNRSSMGTFVETCTSEWRR